MQTHRFTTTNLNGCRAIAIAAVAVLAMHAASTAAMAQLSYASSGSTVTETFDSLGSSGTLPWTNDSTLPGWVLFRRPAPGTAISSITGGTGSSNAGAFYSFGNSGDRAVGGVGSGGSYWGSPSTNSVAGWIAVGLTNNTGATINEFTVNYDGEEWRCGGNTTAQTMVLEYGFGSSFTSVSSWTAAGSAFDFTSPVAVGSASALDGNSAANRVAGLGGAINASWGVGQTLWIRWVENNDAGNDHGLAIDNFTFRAGPAFNDCNSNGQNDSADIASGSSLDCNENNVPDECETDCNSNGQPDDCDIADFSSDDCNNNNIPDECETGDDCDANGIPDECELATGDCDNSGVLDVCETFADCNTNGTPDSCDIANLSSIDCNEDGTPDECQPLSGSDCNTNGQDDLCEMATDCNANGYPDECDIAGGTSSDVNNNDTPDDCEDCNNNGVLDLIDIAQGTSSDCNNDSIADECQFVDCNTNGVNDSCDVAMGTSSDCNNDFFPDECSSGTFAYTSFEVPLPVATQYVDTLSPATDHALLTNPDEPVVNFAAAGGEIGFTSFYTNTRNDVGLSEGDFVGVTDFFNDVGAYTDGQQGFQIGDPDGLMTVTFDTISLVGRVNPSVSIDVFVNTTGYETAPLDRMRAWVVVDGGVAIDMLNTATAPGGPDINNLGIEGTWITLTADLSGYTTATLKIESDTNVADETLYFDNVRFFQNGDCNENGVPDVCELESGDCNNNGVLDACESFADCNTNGVSDPCDISDMASDDCNINGIPDECESSTDCNTNGTPDECEAGADCNSNGTLDICELLADCDTNGTPDVCETITDCNNNGTPDACDINGGGSNDANGNSIPDECEDCNENGVVDGIDIAQGTSSDCNNDGIPDDCQFADCNDNGVHDACDIAVGTSNDCDLNGVPDECVGGDFAGTSFEVPLPVAVQYVDTLGGDNDHALIDNPGEPAVNFTAAGGEIGFTAFYTNTRDDVGLSEGDFVGVTDFFNNVGTYTDGQQGYQIGDPDGLMTVTFDTINVAGRNSPSVSIDVFVKETGWETAPIDRVRVWVVVDGGVEIDLLNSVTAVGGPDIDDLGIEGAWMTLSADLTGYTTATLKFEVDSNAADEAVYFDNVRFSAQGATDCNENGIPDTCELDTNDCNTNGTPDDCDIASGASDDVNLNGTPDECEVGGGCTLCGDVNSDGTVDGDDIQCFVACTLAAGDAGCNCDCATVSVADFVAHLLNGTAISCP